MSEAMRGRDDDTTGALATEHNRLLAVGWLYRGKGVYVKATEVEIDIDPDTILDPE